MRQIWTAPNQLTLLRLVFIPFIVINVAEGDYGWALGLFIAAGISDGLDGLLARILKQKTLLGQFLDPIADKLLLSTLFLVLSFKDRIPWKVTILVLSRDVIIIIVCAVLYMTVNLRDFKPSIFGKLNTVAQVLTLGFVLLDAVVGGRWVDLATMTCFWVTIGLTVLSGVHYLVRTGQRLHQMHYGRSAAA
jgi:cardiolipin synthase